jgi:hypothetical protein
MKKVKLSILGGPAVLMSLIAAVILLGYGCGSSTNNGDQQGTPAIADKSLKINNAPKNGLVGQIYHDKTNNRDWIFDGAQWVPHDNTVEAYYEQLKQNAATRDLTQAEVCVDGDPACTPTGNHGLIAPYPPSGHGTFLCQVCHNVGGRLAFQKNGLAYATGQPAPYFDATAKTCSNIGCHTVKAGTFSYYFQGGDGEPVLNTASYGGGAPRTTPSWFAILPAAQTCTLCHDDPPRLGSSGANVWHSGYHGGQGPTGAYNQCQFCHPDASSPNNGIGDTITNATLHANGTVNVVATFKSACFNCH